MAYLKKDHGIWYVVTKVKDEGIWREKYLTNAGKDRIKAEEELERWQFKPTKKYRTVIIDPPWEIDKIKREVRPNQIEMDYPTMSLDEIKNFGIYRISKLFDESGCHVYLWTTQKHLKDAYYLFDEWEINYQCLLTWVKNVGFTPYSWMYSTEFVLFGRMGNLDVIKKGVRTDFFAKVREHSRKPDEFYNIVRKVSPDPRIDIFSREKREGFDQYGNEADKFKN